MASIDVESLCLELQTPKAQISPRHEEPQTPKAPPSPPQTLKAQKEQQPKAQKVQQPKAPKVQHVLYLGVEIELSTLQPILTLDAVVALFEKYPELKRKDTFHITLCFFQKKCEDKGAIVEEFKRFIEEHGKEVSITVTGIGYHEGTCALQVSPVILTMDGSNITAPWTHEKQNHITIALEEGKSAKNSVLAVMKQEESCDYPGDFISFEPGIIINGNLKPFSS
jgi:hypothetical protein